MKMNERPLTERLVHGKNEEAKVIDCLNKYHGRRLEPASLTEDKTNKTDAFETCLVTGNRLRNAVKVREPNEAGFDDILVAVRDIWYGPDHANNRIGRDIKVAYEGEYIVRSSKKTVIYAAKAVRIHEIIHDMEDEWKSANYKLPMKSEKHKGCLLKWSRDKDTRIPKVLGFIPPKYLKEGEITLYEYKED